MFGTGTRMARNGHTGVIFNTQRYALHDGPGIRTTVFFKGCPLACDWCANPEGRNAAPDVFLTPGRCIRCGACVRVCPAAAVTLDAAGVTTDRTRCTRCGACVDACPAEARSRADETVTVDELMARVERDRVFFDTSGGGVTFSGGEPLAQAAFLERCLAACREREIHTAVDTSGAAAAETLDAVAALADLFLYDLKLMDDARHREHTGVSNVPILDNLRRLVADGHAVWIRVPLIPGLNDDPANLDALATFVGDLNPVPPVCLLPYHRLGGDKADRLGQPSTLASVRPPTAEAVAAAVERLSARGLNVKIGG